MRRSKFNLKFDPKIKFQMDCVWCFHQKEILEIGINTVSLFSFYSIQLFSLSSKFTSIWSVFFSWEYDPFSNKTARFSFWMQRVPLACSTKLFELSKDMQFRFAAQFDHKCFVLYFYCVILRIVIDWKNSHLESILLTFVFHN